MGNLIANARFAIGSCNGEVASSDYIHSDKEIQVPQLTIGDFKTFKSNTVL